MSEFPFDGSPSDDAPAQDRTRKLLLAGALAAALAVGGGVLLLSGGDGDTGSTVVAQPVRHRATPSAAPAPVAPVAPAQVALAVQVRNPYKALHVAPTGGAAASGPAGSPAPQTTATAPPSSGPTATPSATTYSVKLVKIDRTDPTFPLATFSVDGSPYVVVAAQRFGKGGDLVLLAYVKDKTGALIGALIQHGAEDPVKVLTGKTTTVS